MKYCLLMCLWGSITIQAMVTNSWRGEDTALLPSTQFDIQREDDYRRDRRCDGLTGAVEGLAAQALGTGFFYAAIAGTGDAIMVPIMYVGGAGFIVAGTVILANGIRKLCCGTARIFRRK